MTNIKRHPFRKHPKINKKGFIAAIIIDFWSYVMFILIIIIFAFLYKYLASSTAERLSDFKGATYSNYLASVYLRTPILIDTPASLIA
ncbi:hypothetical protein ACFL0V_04745, partial [Nanoarchaeota archaeon]